MHAGRKSFSFSILHEIKITIYIAIILRLFVKIVYFKSNCMYKNVNWSKKEVILFIRKKTIQCILSDTPVSFEQSEVFPLSVLTDNLLQHLTIGQAVLIRKRTRQCHFGFFPQTIVILWRYNLLILFFLFFDDWIKSLL